MTRHAVCDSRKTSARSNSGNNFAKYHIFMYFIHIPSHSKTKASTAPATTPESTKNFFHPGIQKSKTSGLSRSQNDLKWPPPPQMGTVPTDDAIRPPSRGLSPQTMIASWRAAVPAAKGEGRGTVPTEGEGRGTVPTEEGLSHQHLMRYFRRHPATNMNFEISTPKAAMILRSALSSCQR